MLPGHGVCVCVFVCVGYGSDANIHLYKKDPRAFVMQHVRRVHRCVPKNPHLKGVDPG